MKGYKNINVKPDEEYKSDYKRSGDKNAVQAMIKDYNKKVRQYFKKYIKNSLEK